MKFLNITKQIIISGLFALILTSCKKVAVPEPMGDVGQTLVKLVGGSSPASVLKEPISFVPVSTKLKSVIDIRRILPNNAELNKTMTVVIKDDIEAVNAANPNYVDMPANLYQIVASDGVAKVGGIGGTYTFTFSPGDFAKQINIIVPDPTLLDPSTLYGLGFTIKTVDAGGIITEENSVVIEIGAKNIVHEDLKWDFYRWNLASQAGSQPGSPRSSGWDGEPITLTTISANANEIYSGYFIQPRYRLSFTNSGGTATNFVLSINPGDLAALNGGGVTIVEGPNILIADFATKHYKFQYQVFNGSAYRYLIDDYHK